MLSRSQVLIVFPIVWGLILIGSLAAVLIISSERNYPDPPISMWVFAFSLISAHWIQMDSIRRKEGYPADMVFLFPVAFFPLYFLQRLPDRGGCLAVLCVPIVTGIMFVLVVISLATRFPG